jgi:hypothetical protein
VIELYADQRRKLRVDPAGREMLISCGAALFGLRLAVRSLGYLPVVKLLPDPARPRLLARVRLGAAEPMTARERQMLEALPHRHAHRGPLADGPLPAGLLAGLQHDALAKGPRWHWSTRPSPTSGWPTSLPRPGRRQDLDPLTQAEVAGGAGARPILPATASRGRIPRLGGEPARAAAAARLRPWPWPGAAGHRRAAAHRHRGAAHAR